MPTAHDIEYFEERINQLDAIITSTEEEERLYLLQGGEASAWIARTMRAKKSVCREHRERLQRIIDRYYQDISAI